MVYRRIIVVVLDSAGIGAMPDAERYGDAGANTLGNIARTYSFSALANMAALGLGHIAPLHGLDSSSPRRGAVGKMAEASDGKDTTTGHWELMGILTDIPFMTFPFGFPQEITSQFTVLSKRGGFLGNKAASGTEIIAELGDEHVRTGKPIIYTSADSVFQIAAHEEVIPLQELYEICEKTRAFLNPYKVGRVIARPFLGTSGAYKRTGNRHDYSIPLPGPTTLDFLANQGLLTIGIGKIENIFNGQGVGESFPTHNNAEGISALLTLLRERKDAALLFANLVDFDMLYGHRNDVEGYFKALAAFDQALPSLLNTLEQDDLLLITADHGCDPCYPGTDHTREYVPLICYSKQEHFCPADLGVRASFADVGRTIADNFEVASSMTLGTSFLDELQQPIS